MIFGNNNFVSNIKIGNETVNIVNVANIFIIVDSKLAFKQHFKNVLSKLSSVSGITFRNRDYMSKKVLIKPYL